MPANIYADMMTASTGIEDQRALQLAFELSLLGLGGEDEPSTTSPNSTTVNSSSSSSSFEDSNARKRSANMTECVPVPSSEHVAEIVGRQGCKIKALRAKTNTYIKTPVRGEEPVFVVTGRKEDVNSAKREILSAAEHFSQIRASRRNSSVSSVGSSNGSTLTPGPPSPNAPGQVTIQVRVPYRVVGLVVGPKGATIKRIQQQTHTYIVTPSRDKEPVFEVTGLPDNVEKARQEIESHIAMRTGGLVDTTNLPSNHGEDFPSNGLDSGFHELNGDFMGSIYKPHSTSGSAFTSYGSSNVNGNSLLSRRSQEATIFNFPPVNGSTSSTSKISPDFPNPLSNGFGAFNGFSVYDNDEGIGSPSFDPIPPSPSMWPDFSSDNRNSLVSIFGNTNSPPSTSPRRSSSFAGGMCPSSRISPPLTENGTSASSSPPSNMTSSPAPSISGDHQMVRRIRSDPLSNGLSNMNGFTTPPSAVTNGFACVSTSSGSPTHSSTATSSPTPTSDASGPVTPAGTGPSPTRPRKHCLICNESEVVAALVPCGHNLFCMECASLIVEKPSSERACPVCQQTPTQAIRIFS
ncbi:RNA-binding protein MEX3B-like [Haliotis cracherodii]|uniref:RNA-binding protein MEX3B-like n=1 Tax=Haliotis rufescens TaxID=6454 RepID=UPI001EAFDE2C|nr:RNA-binding protein MEX3B-like [Haliotis rufescens]